MELRDASVGTPRARTARRTRRPGFEALEPRWLLAGNVNEFPIPTAAGIPDAITAGPDGNLWFVEYGGDKIGEINPTTHAIAEFPLPTPDSGPTGITAGPDGNLWFTEFNGQQIGEINPTTHAIAEFPIPAADSFPMQITAGPDGNLWFTAIFSVPFFQSRDEIGQINPTTHAITEFPLAGVSYSTPDGITAGPDGSLWFTESKGNDIGQINPTTHAIAEFPIPTPSSKPTSITAGPGGSLWFTESSGNKIGQINPTTHAIAEFPIPTPDSGPTNITAGPDGSLWFTESSGNQIGQINPTTHAIAEFPIPTPSSVPTGITVGPDGNPWFTEFHGNKIGEFTNIVVTPPVTITSMQTPTLRVKIGTGKRAHTVKETVIQLHLSGPLNGTGNLAAYQLLGGTTRKHITTFKQKVPLASVIYDPATLTVTLFPKGKLNLTKPEKLTVIAGLLTDSFGNPFNGGTNFISIFSRRGIAPALSNIALGNGTLSAAAADAVFAADQPNIAVGERGSQG